MFPTGYSRRFGKKYHVFAFSAILQISVPMVIGCNFQQVKIAHGIYPKTFHVRTLFDCTELHQEINFYVFVCAVTSLLSDSINYNCNQ